MSDGKKAAHEDADEAYYRSRVRIVQGTSPAEFLKIFDELKVHMQILHSSDLSLTYRDHVRLKSIEALIQKLP